MAADQLVARGPYHATMELLLTAWWIGRFISFGARTWLEPACARRYDKLANEVLADSTVAGGDSSVQYLAAAAALQQWEQAALAFLLLHGAGEEGTPLRRDALSEGVESLLEDKFQVSMGFSSPHIEGLLCQEAFLVCQRRGQVLTLPVNGYGARGEECSVCRVRLQALRWQEGMGEAQILTVQEK